MLVGARRAAGRGAAAPTGSEGDALDPPPRSVRAAPSDAADEPTASFPTGAGARRARSSRAYDDGGDRVRRRAPRRARPQAVRPLAARAGRRARRRRPRRRRRLRTGPDRRPPGHGRRRRHRLRPVPRHGRRGSPPLPRPVVRGRRPHGAPAPRLGGDHELVLARAPGAVASCRRASRRWRARSGPAAGWRSRCTRATETAPPRRVVGPRRSTSTSRSTRDDVLAAVDAAGLRARSSGTSAVRPAPPRPRRTASTCSPVGPGPRPRGSMLRAGSGPAAAAGTVLGPIMRRSATAARSRGREAASGAGVPADAS